MPAVHDPGAGWTGRAAQTNEPTRLDSTRRRDAPSAIATTSSSRTAPSTAPISDPVTPGGASAPGVTGLERRVGDHGHAVRVHRQEPGLHGGPDDLAGHRGDPDLTPPEHRQQRRVPRQDADLTLGGRRA